MTTQPLHLPETWKGIQSLGVWQPHKHPLYPGAHARGKAEVGELTLSHPLPRLWRNRTGWVRGEKRPLGWLLYGLRRASYLCPGLLEGEVGPQLGLRSQGACARWLGPWM